MYRVQEYAVLSSVTVTRTSMSIVTRRFLRSLPIVAVTVAAAASTAAAQRGRAAGAASTRVERLAALADVYGAVYYFHPSVAASYERKAAWDSVVAAGVEAVERARTAAEYSAAVRGMLAWLGDSAS